MTDDENIAARMIELEVKLAYQEETLGALNTALIEKERRLGALEDTVGRLEKALRILADRQAGAADNKEIAGAHPELDPVPRSG